MIRLTAAEARGLRRSRQETGAKAARTPQEPRSKYRAQRTTVDGIAFHSAAESRRYSQLKLLEKAGEIRNLELQPRFPLFVETPLQHAPVQVGVYVADFSYETGTDALSTVIEDVKGGPTTALYRLKKKIVEAQYGIRIVEVR